MGGSVSLIQKNEIINWKIESHSSIQFSIKGDHVLEAQRQKQEKNEVPTKPIVIGPIQDDGPFKIIDIHEDGKNKILEIQNINNLQNFFLHTKRMDSWTSHKKKFLQYVLAVFPNGGKHILAKQLCHQYECKKDGWNTTIGFGSNNHYGYHRGHHRNRHHGNRHRWNHGHSGWNVNFKLNGGYDKIVNPLTGRYVKINGVLGQKIIQNYLEFLKNKKTKIKEHKNKEKQK